MTAAAYGLVAVGAVLAAADWAAVGLHQRRLEYAFKPAAMLLLIGAAVVLRPQDQVQRWLFAAALACGLAGDVLLMLPRERFLAGVGAFLAGHALYVAGFLALGLPPLRLATAAAVTAVAVALGARPVVLALRRRHPHLLRPVLVYIAAVAAMLACALATLNPLAMAGGLLFALSDFLLAVNRWLRPLPTGRVVSLVPYHLGQIGLVLALARFT
jgi:uncharacterized membrane protein YhhN